MNEGAVSRYGVYRDLNQSPYEYHSPYGDLFKFRSQKKLDIYRRDIEKEIERLSKCVGRIGLDAHLPGEILHLLYRSTYKALYDRVEG